jgi:DNA helicase IV
MKALIEVSPSPEQLALFSRIQPGVEVIRGAAGSGKTTTALLKLRAAVGAYVRRRRRQSDQGPVRVLVLTFNRTLRGYINELAHRQFSLGQEIILEVSTFSSWAHGLLGKPTVMENDATEAQLRYLASKTAMDTEFAIAEASYVLGRFLPEDLENYLHVRRDGRGATPRMERASREILLNEIINPYLEGKNAERLVDWNDLAVALVRRKVRAYDVVVVDETQDFSANEIRAIMSQVATEHTVTFVLDTTQRIYSRSGFSWQEVGVQLRPENSFRLKTNYRNTKQIARFAASLLEDIDTDPDGTLPDFESAITAGDLPVVVEGGFGRQMDYAIDYIKRHVDLSQDSVAFLHVKGGGWFSSLKARLEQEQLPYVSIARKPEWPSGGENIALSTIHSVKGLEFDHVFILGLNGEVEPDDLGDEEGEDFEPLVRLRRLVAMGVGRARKTIMVGYKPEDAPVVAGFFGDGTFVKVAL